MTQSKPVPTLVVYRLKNGTDDQFRPLLAKHWPTLNEFGLVTKERAKIWRAVDRRKEGQVVYVELMEWKDESSAELAHQTPAVMKIWEPMGPILENLEILHLEPEQL